VVPAVLAANAGALIVAIGDDTTDEELFSALPPESIRVRVGPGESRAEVRLEGVAQVRELLRLVLG
jgi:trehalose 6-phosphate synthase/phosphatase